MPTPTLLHARLLPRGGDLEALFVALHVRTTAERGVFWLDAGANARVGWSYLGSGSVTTDATKLRTTVLVADASTASPAEVEPPFRGGWVGWLSYEEGARRAGAPVHLDESVMPEAWIAVTRAIAFDHSSGRAWALAGDGDQDAWGDELDRIWSDNGHASEAGSGVASETLSPELAASAVATERHSVGEYTALVEECRSAIRAGDAYQLCLTTRFSVPFTADPLQAYLRLRHATPAHHGGFVRVGDYSLLSASPEQFVGVSDGRVSTKPIKGTRPRGATPEQDRALAEELLASEKERAENVMIVDLMRNDLSRVSVPGSIRVDALWQVESYPAVHQLVSAVSGELRETVTVGELLDAVFPAGSMTGAPKLSAMTLLSQLEGAPRGVYSGCFGHIDLDGNVDLAMVIRSIVLDGRTAVVGAGGGITWLSEPDEEAAEVATKASAPLSAVGAALPVEWAKLLHD